MNNIIVKIRINRVIVDKLHEIDVLTLTLLVQRSDEGRHRKKTGNQLRVDFQNSLVNTEQSFFYFTL